MNISEPILRFANVNKKFGQVVIAENLSFEVTHGVALGIVGPNGAGKSTLFSLISGNQLLDDGEIYFKGEAISKLSPAERAQRGIARTFQIPKPFGNLSVFENTLVASTFGANRFSKKLKEDNAIQALQTTGIFEKRNEIAGQLRLLDRKRLELARVIASNPELVLLDEIAGGLSDLELPKLIQIIRNLISSGITVIWIEHLMHALSEVVQDLFCLYGGEIIARGKPAEVLNNEKVIDLYLGSSFEVNK